MSHLPALMTAHQDFDWDGDSPGIGEPVLMRSPRFVHAVLAEAPGPVTPWFQDYVRTGSAWHALCGVEVLVVTSTFFDGLAKGSCRKCAAIVDRWLDDESLVRWDRSVSTPVR
jgi:hypothetical protein